MLTMLPSEDSIELRVLLHLLNDNVVRFRMRFALSEVQNIGLDWLETKSCSSEETKKRIRDLVACLIVTHLVVVCR